MEHNIKIINSYLLRQPNYITLKKKNKLYIRDGIVTYTIDLMSYRCQCSQHLCYHILFSLEQQFKCDVKLFKFFHKIKLQLHLIGTYDELLSEIKKHIDPECGICSANMTVNNDLYECKLCSKHCHQTCLNKWINTIKNNPKHDKTCIYCHACSYI